MSHWLYLIWLESNLCWHLPCNSIQGWHKSCVDLAWDCLFILDLTPINQVTQKTFKTMLKTSCWQKSCQGPGEENITTLRKCRELLKKLNTKILKKKEDFMCLCRQVGWYFHVSCDNIIIFFRMKILCCLPAIILFWGCLQHWFKASLPPFGLPLHTWDA